MNKLVLFYCLLATIVVGKTLSTIYQRSVVIHHGSEVYQLQQEKVSLHKKKMALIKELANKNSLLAVQSQMDANKYESIAQPVVISAPKLATSQL